VILPQSPELCQNGGLSIGETERKVAWGLSQASMVDGG
jgi:hypothetical protein